MKGSHVCEDVPDRSRAKAAALIQRTRVQEIVLLSGNGHEIGPALKARQEFVDDELSESLTAVCRRYLDPFQYAFSDICIQFSDAGGDDLVCFFIMDGKPEVRRVRWMKLVRRQLRCGHPLRSVAG